jgi:signal transduction histidine kinase
LGHDVDRIIQALQPAEGELSSTCDVASVVEARTAFWSAHAANQGRVCEIDVGEPAWVPLSPDALGAVVDALLENVFRHTPAAAPVGVSVVRHAGWVTLVVEDGGTGVADPSSALHRGSSGGGSTGLGLDIARAAAEATGGTIHLERGRLGGARVRLRFGEANSHHSPTSDVETAESASTPLCEQCRLAWRTHETARCRLRHLGRREGRAAGPREGAHA